jgi:signal transduction histidine kinase
MFMVRWDSSPDSAPVNPLRLDGAGSRTAPLIRAARPTIDPRVTAPGTDALLSALAARGDAVAILDGERVIAQSDGAAALGDLVALAARTVGAPEVVRCADGRSLEVITTVGSAGRVLLARDVSDRVALERALSRSDQILAIGSHELKGPLHVIGMICHLIETRTARGDVVDRATVERLRRQATRLNRLLNELLDASRLREGRMVLDVELLDVVDLVNEQMAAATTARTGDFSLSLPARAPVRGDRARLGAVVFQLLDNAVRFTQPGTPIHVSLDSVDGSWRLVVTDEGPGVPAEQERHLFEREPPGGRLPPSSSLGLGLFVAAAAVRLHGGTIAHARGPRGGATFTVRLPASA